MTDPSPLPPPMTPSAGPPHEEPERAEVPPRAGEPAPPGSFEGRARAFREDQVSRRSEQRERIGALIVVVILVLGVLTILTARPYSPSSENSFPTPGPPILVTLGTPVVSSIPCHVGENATAERVAWKNATQSVVTGDVNPRLYEIWDGDIIPVATSVANVTPTDLCAGAAPDPTHLAWYLVLTSPNGSVLLTYTAAQGWASVSHGSANIPIENGSALVVITGVSLAGTGRGLAVIGFAGGSPVRGTVPL